MHTALREIDKLGHNYAIANQKTYGVIKPNVHKRIRTGGPTP